MQKDALTIPELAARLKSRIPEGQTKGSVWDLLDKVIFIDSTWQQTHRILIVSYGLWSSQYKADF